MNLIIRNTSGQPIYDQITAQIKAMILSGELAPGDALPSMRALAKDLRISLITTKRAYEENLRQIETHLSACIALAAQAGVTENELHEMLSLLCKGE